MKDLTDNVRTLFRKYLTAAVGGALVVTIYSLVDTIAVGQSEGAAGTAAMAVITPVYGVQAFLSFFIGIGGSVLLGAARGEGDEERANAFFTAAVLLMSVAMVLTWGIFALFSRQILFFFGATEETMPLVMEYVKWLIRCWPVFVFSIFISSFIRNDGAPALAMAAVIAGGCVNIFGDWFLVFPMGMGMEGAALATVIGTALQCVVMATHFFSKRCRLRLVWPRHLGRAVRRILSVGIGSSMLDLGTVVIAVVANNQILRYGGTTELAVYGVISTLTSLFQAIFCGVGQALQPLASVNYGARQYDRVHAFLRMALGTSISLGVLFTLLVELFPCRIIRLFMDVTPEVLAAAPGIVRPYGLLYLFLSVTALAAYYLQSVLQDKASMVVGVLRSLVLSSALLLLLPIVLGIQGVWLALPASEMLVTVLAAVLIVRQDRRLTAKQ